MTGPTIWVNGRLAPAHSAHISARDRGFTLGDGLFETIRVRDGRLLNLERHLRRLRAGAAILDLPLVWKDSELTEVMIETLSANGLTDAVLRLTVSRGVPNSRGLLPDPDAPPTVVVDVRPFDGYPQEVYDRGMHVVISRVRRNEHSPLTRAKTLSYLENILARKEARAAGGDESVLLNTAGNVASASAANLFLVFEDVLVTPDLSSGALPGTTRALILEELAQAAGLGATERPVEPEDLDKASEIFLTSALLGVMPVTVVDGRPVGTGRPGPTAARLHLALMSSWSGSVPRR